PEVFGPNHPEVARSRHNLAAVFRTQGDPRQAETLERASLETLTRRQGARHPDVAGAWAYLAWIHATAPNWSTAADEMQLARQLYREPIGRVLSSRSDAQQLGFLATKDQPQFHAALTIAVRALASADGRLPAEKAERLRQQAAEWLFNGKSVTPE